MVNQAVKVNNRMWILGGNCNDPEGWENSLGAEFDLQIFPFPLLTMFGSLN